MCKYREQKENPSWIELFSIDVMEEIIPFSIHMIMREMNVCLIGNGRMAMHFYTSRWRGRRIRRRWTLWSLPLWGEGQCTRMKGEGGRKGRQSPLPHTSKNETRSGLICLARTCVCTQHGAGTAAASEGKREEGIDMGKGHDIHHPPLHHIHTCCLWERKEIQ